MAIISGIVGAVVAAGSWLAGLTGVAGFVVKTGLAIGLSYAAQALAGKPKPQQNPPFSIQGSIRASGAIARSYMSGTGMTAGSLAYANCWGPAGGTPNSYLVQVIALSDLPDKGLEEVWVNGELVTLLTGEAHADYGIPVSEYRKDGTDHLWIKFYDGTQTAADPYLVDKFEEDELYPYEDTREGVGITYVICTARVNETLFTGFPEYKFVLQGAKFYDPSKDTTAGGDGSQRWATPSTWGGDGDNLPAVQLYNLNRGIYYDGDWFYGLQGVAGAQIPDEEWIAAIEKCREEVEGPDGNEPQYRCGGEIAVSTRIADTVEALLTSCNGRLAEIGGFYKPKVGSPDEPVGEFTDGDIIATAGQSFTPFHGLADTINGIAAKYPEPAEGWNVKSAPTRLDATFEAQDGGRRLLADVDYSMVPYKGQVQRLMESALLEARRARRHTITLPPRFWQYEPGDVLEWTSERNGYEAKSFRIDGMTDLGNLDVLVDLTEVDASDYDWDQETDYVPPVDGPVGISRPQPQPIIDWFAEPYTIQDSSASPRRAAIKLSWDGNVDDVEAVEFEVRLDGETEIILTGRTDSVASGALIISQNLLPDEDYEVRGRYIPTSYRDTLWSDWLEVTTPTVAEVDLSAEIYALLRRVEELGGDFRVLRRLIEQNAGAQAIDQVKLEETAGLINQGVGAVYQENKAAAEIALQAAVTAQSALAQFLVGLIAQTPGGSSEVNFRAIALSDLADGQLARIALQARVDTGGEFAETGLELSVISTPSGPEGIVVLSGDNIYFKIGDVTIPVKGLRRADEVPEVPIVAGSPKTVQADLSFKHESFVTTLDDDVKYLLPLGISIGARWLHTFVQDGVGNEITFDPMFYIQGLDEPQADPDDGSESVFSFYCARMDPPKVTVRLEQSGNTAYGSVTMLSLNPPLNGQSIYDLNDGDLIIQGPYEGTVTALGENGLECNIEGFGPGGSSGGLSHQGVAVVQSTEGTDTTFNGLTAGAGKRSQSKAIVNGSYGLGTPGGLGGTASGADTNTNGNNAGPGGWDSFGEPLAQAGFGAAAPSPGGAQINYGYTPGTLAGSPGNYPGGGARGAAFRGLASPVQIDGTGGGGSGAKFVHQYGSGDRFTGTATLVVGDSGIAGTGNITNGARGAAGRVKFSKI